MAGKHKKSYIADIVLLVAVAVILAITMAFSRSIELDLGLCRYVDAQTGEVVKNRAEAAARADGPAELRVHFLDVGQGDCTIIELPDGKTMIIDGGENIKAVRTAIIDYIDVNLPDGFKYFDYAILTHADSDHCGSLDDVLDAYPARTFYRPNVEATNKGYSDPGKAELTVGAKTKDTVAYKNCIDSGYRANADFTSRGIVTDPSDETQTIYGGSGDDIYTFNFYSPLSDSYTDWNDYSPIMILNYRGFMFAMSGDAEKKNEAEFVQRTADARTDGVKDKYDVFTDDFTVNVVKAGHHGSRTSTSKAYLDAITTEAGAAAAYYIISCGAGNEYEHPHSETLDRLDGMNVPQANILRTDISGDLPFSVKTDADGVYKMFYGDAPTSAIAGVLPELPNGAQPSPPEPTPDPEPTPEPEPTPNPEPELLLVYREWNGIKLTWAVVAWSGYAVLVVVVLLHVALTYAFGRNGGDGKNGKNSKKGGKGRRRGR